MNAPENQPHHEEHTRQPHYRVEDIGLAIDIATVGERVTSLDKRLAEHVVQDNLFQAQMITTQVEVGKTLKAIEISMAGWRGTAVTAVAAVSAVWAVVVLLIQFWNK